MVQGVRRICTQTPTHSMPLTETVRHFLKPSTFVSALNRRGVERLFGVPDSLLKDFCGYVQDNQPENNQITANEGTAIALAAGYHMATSKIPLVYFQNSGQGNAINPLGSLAHPRVNAVPMVLLCGWRGEPNKKDEPQHKVAGEAMESLFEAMGIPHAVLPDYEDGLEEFLDDVLADDLCGPTAILVKRQTFEAHEFGSEKHVSTLPSRKECMAVVADVCAGTPVVASTGFPGREWHDLMVERNGTNDDFLAVGSMGHASAIATGVALEGIDVVCIDGDGSVLMHAGNLCTNARLDNGHLIHVVLNNGAHESVGAQPTGCESLFLSGIAKESGYEQAVTVETAEHLRSELERLRKTERKGAAMIEVRTKVGTGDLGRPLRTPLENKQDFMDKLQAKRASQHRM